MKDYTVKELVNMSHDNPKGFLSLAPYINGLSNLTGKDDYCAIFGVLSENIRERHSKEIAKNIKMFVAFTDYKVKTIDEIDDNDDESTVTVEAIEISGKPYSLSCFKRDFIEYLEHKEEADPRYLECLDDTMPQYRISQILNSEAYKMIWLVNEKHKLDFEMPQKEEGSTKKLINKI